MGMVCFAVLLGLELLPRNAEALPVNMLGID